MLNQLVIKSLTILLLSLFPGLMITPGLYITSPDSGEVVEGVVEIRGSVPEENFSSAELLFAYSQSENESWFLIKRLDKVIQDDVLATWDTTTITDGVYKIALVLHTQDEAKDKVVIENIHVSNYSRVTDQPAGDQPVRTATPISAADILVVSPAPTEPEGNPASILPQEMQKTVVIGIILTSAALGLLVLYTSVQTRRRRR